MTPPIGYSYSRFSSIKQGKGSSLYRQTHDTIAGESPDSWCARNNVVFDTSLSFRDLGKSAYSGHKQEELYAFLQMVKERRILPGSYLLVERIDRITRKGVDEGGDLLKKILKAGVNIVTLSNGRVYGPDAVTGLMKGWLELEIHLEQAQQYSQALSARVGAAWEGKRKKVREKNTLATTAMPSWLQAKGTGDDRRAEVIPEKVAVVKRIFDLVIGGHGLTRILRTLVEEGVPPLTKRQTWSRTTLRRIISDRTVLGEYQPMRGRGKTRVPDGEPVQNYYPPIINLDTFHKAQACLGTRKLNNVGRESKLLNIFSGLLKDARTGKSYITTLRVEKGDKRHHVLMSAVKAAGSTSFPFTLFENAVLACLNEINPKELFPDNTAADEVVGLSGELATIEGDIESISAEIDREFSPALAAVLRKKEARKKEVAAKLAEARLRAASPMSESWGEAKSLLEVIGTAEDPGNVKLRLKSVLRRVVENIYLVVAPVRCHRFALVQVHFKDAVRRTYLIYNRAAAYGRQGLLLVCTWSSRPGGDDTYDTEVDLSDRDQAERMYKSLAETPQTALDAYAALADPV